MNRRSAITFLVLTQLVLVSLGQEKKRLLVWTDPVKAKAEDPDFSIQGEYVATKPRKKGLNWGVQVVADGDGRFRAFLLTGGLPGAGFLGKRIALRDREIDGRRLLAKGHRLSDGSVHFESEGWRGVLKDGVMTGTGKNTPKIKAFWSTSRRRRIERSSPTAGAKPPAGAVVLFDGTKESLARWKGGRITADGLLCQGTTSVDTFGSHRLHLEFRTPYKPHARGQGRGNSGLYVQGRFETQILDSFGLTGEMNECGGLYSIAAPKVNACLPPLTWQTYDIDFTAATFENGKKVKNARMTVRLNGVLIHDDQELPKSTTASPLKDEPGPGPVYLQNHGNPVRFRNIWVVAR